MSLERGGARPSERGWGRVWEVVIRVGVGKWLWLVCGEGARGGPKGQKAAQKLGRTLLYE